MFIVDLLLRETCFVKVLSPRNGPPEPTIPWQSELGHPSVSEHDSVSSFVK